MSSDPNTERVRIALAIDANGNWNACGWKANGETNEGAARDAAIDGLFNDGPYSFHWIEATVKKPQTETIEGEVKSEKEAN